MIPEPAKPRPEPKITAKPQGQKRSAPKGKSSKLPLLLIGAGVAVFSLFLLAGLVVVAIIVWTPASEPASQAHVAKRVDLNPANLEAPQKPDVTPAAKAETPPTVKPVPKAKDKQKP